MLGGAGEAADIAQKGNFEHTLGHAPAEDGYDQVSDSGRDGPAVRIRAGAPPEQSDLLIAYRHGLRASEVGLLRTSDLDFKKLRILVHRLNGSYSGEHPLQSDEAKAVRTYLRTRGHESPVLFTSNRGDPISRRTLDW